MKIQFRHLLILVATCALFHQNLYAQSFVPSQQQIEQFKNLPRAQQEQLARQMGFDLSILEAGAAGNNSNTATTPEPEFVEREVDEKEIASDLARQSVAEARTKQLKPFGYELFQTRQEMVTPSANSPVPSNYLIGPGDSIVLKLFGKESGTFELTVNNEGQIDIPELGPLTVTGLMFDELKSLVGEKYSQQKIGVNPFISMGQLRTIQVFLVGEVYRPGPISMSGLSTVMGALMNSGGVNNMGSLRNIQVKRSGKTVSTFDLYDLIISGDTSQDVRLEQGDVIFVPAAGNIVSVDGQVRRPAIFEVLPKETMADVLKYSGGLLPSADARQIQVVRNDVASGLSVKSISMVESKDLAMHLKNGDFLNIPKANLEFNNAILVKGAVNLPNVIANTGLSLSDLVNERSLLANTDLNYALIVRRGRFDEKTEILQFKPNDVLANNTDIDLQAFDEVMFFNRIAFNDARGIEQSVTAGNLNTSQDDLNTIEADYIKGLERNRFNASAFAQTNSIDKSRRELLAPLISRLKSEANNESPVQLVEVTGQVRYPGVYPLPNESNLSNILDAAGGLTESAHLENAEITRLKIVDRQSVVDHVRVSLIQQLLLPIEQQVKLGSKDILNVVRIPQWYENNSIELKGEVVFPGRYQISQGEKLSDVIKRAGGFTSDASLNAAIFTREELRKKERENIDKAVDDLRQQIANNNLSTSQFSRTVDYATAKEILDDLTSIQPIGRMVIELESYQQEDQFSDIELKNGDQLIIPNITPAVSVIGEVFVTTTHLYNEKLSIDDYIQLAGGAREYADTSKIYIVRANGAVMVPESDFWFASDNEVLLEPGDTIVVPRDVTNYDNISLWQGVTQIIYQTAIALAAIGSL